MRYAGGDIVFSVTIEVAHRKRVAHVAVIARLVPRARVLVALQVVGGVYTNGTLPVETARAS